MSDFTAVRLGADNNGADKTANFLKVFSGEVLTAFEQSVVTRDKHRVRTISEGASAKFPATWRVAASYHTPGTEIAGQAPNASERVITIDDLLIAPVFIPRIDEAMNHFDARSIYSVEGGRALATEMDQKVLQTAVLAARAAATVTGADGGSALTNASYGTVGATLADGIFTAAETMDDKSIPEEGRNCFVRPAQYWLLVRTTELLNRDWGGKGAYSDGKIWTVAGVDIHKALHVPSTNIATGPAKYQGDFSTTVGVVMHESAVGTLQLLQLATDMEYSARHQGTLVVPKMAVGHGILRPEAAVELKTA